MGPDGRIYHVGDLDEYVATISSPNALGTLCNYQLEGLYLEGKTGGWGLPNFVNSIYQDPPVTASQLCEGDSTFFFVNFPDVDSLYWDFGDPDSGADNFSGEYSPAHFYGELGSYIVTLTYYSGNQIRNYQFLVNIYPYPVIDFGNDTLLCQDETALLDATTEKGYYRWQDNSRAPDYFVDQPGTYWVTVIANSCVSGDTITYEICDEYLIMPTIFSPNGDGLNDRFRPILFKDIYGARIQIYDRWGKLVFESEDVKQGWDGKRKGENADEGVYFWMISYFGYRGIESRLRGSVTLLR